ncbi:MAG: adenylate/guanylate cyclase domain-containing protein, partial [Myxococcota bacterium]|nr:adenylate/guanylate cyclase domain-containing protein [Myxococcota bacterium]
MSRQMHRWLRSRYGVAFALGLGSFALVVFAREAGLLQSLELDAFDAFVRLRPASLDEPPVTLVLVGEDEYRAFGHPIGDGAMADALEALLAAEPRAVGIDIYRDRPLDDGWERLADLFRTHPELVVVEKLADAETPAVPAPDFLADRPGQVGFADIQADPDGSVRRGFLFLADASGGQRVSLALLLSLRYPGLEMGPAPDLPGAVRLGQTTLPPVERDDGGYKGQDAGGYQYPLDYRTPRERFPRMTFSDAVAGRFDPGQVYDRGVLVGPAAPSVKDDFRTPLGRVYGVEVHAQAVDQLIRHGQGRTPVLGTWSEGSERLWILAWCVVAALAGVRSGSLPRLVVTAGLGLGILSGVTYGALVGSLWLPVVPPALGGLGSLALVVAYVTQRERAERAQAMNLFGKYVSRSLVDTVWEQRELFMEGGRPKSQRITVTVLISDLLGYTTRAERSDPAEVMEWLGSYTDRMAHLVEVHGGLVNDFLGDGLMASFGVPIPSDTEEEITRDAAQAVECALAMGEALEALNVAWQRDGKPTARLRIGILTGPAVVGHIGADERMKYATVGNTVNTAARLETHDKLAFEREQSTCRILVGQATIDRVADRFRFESLGE